MCHQPGHKISDEIGPIACGVIIIMRSSLFPFYDLVFLIIHSGGHTNIEHLMENYLKEMMFSLNQLVIWIIK